MTQREKLIKLIDFMTHNTYSRRVVESMADYLLTNGVTILPCKVGDTVYLVYDSGKLSERECCGFNVRDGEVEIIDEFDCEHFVGQNGYYEAFLTRGEAEAALKERAGNG